ncbi:hypothetical protein GYY_04380 [Methanococcus maripaludis X1]|jgi:putative transposon-encoded protein|uniref:Transposon-encoded protein n=1 Tax=Methanococcus maripaludis X1 TaxID=1053692 RepID=G0H4X0_METMI|nr:DUF2080 family transposase-associated protein [Methanococcus maripaludis]AEK19751.1 hypothetical protein GYY_04380 [Methanococcus maripaludis X1]
MKIRKKSWRKPRKMYPTFSGVIKPLGNSGTLDVSIPREYIGKLAFLTVIDDDEEIEACFNRKSES